MLYYTHEQEITGRGDGKFINSRENAIMKFEVRYKGERIIEREHRDSQNGE